jgi:hypothetical protein
MPSTVVIQDGKKMTELCAIEPALDRFAGRRSGPCGIGVAPVRCLQQAQPFADHFLRVLITFPLIFDLQVRPLIGVERLEIGTAKAAIGRVWRRQQCPVGPAQLRITAAEACALSRRDSRSVELGAQAHSASTLHSTTVRAARRQTVSNVSGIWSGPASLAQCFTQALESCA